MSSSELEYKNEVCEESSDDDFWDDSLTGIDISGQVPAANGEPRSEDICFEWSICGNDLPRHQIIRSEIFHPKDCNMDCILSLWHLEENATNAESLDLVLWMNVKRKGEQIYGIFDFYINGTPGNKLVYENDAREDHLICFLSSKALFEGLSAVITMIWNLEKKCIEEDNLPAMLMHKFGCFQESGMFSDADIETSDGSLVPVHQVILAARSSVFCNMLTSGPHETKRKCIRIHDFPTPTVKDVIRYIYMNVLPEYSYSSYTALLEAASRYSVKDLKSACARNLASNLNVSNAIELVVLADTCQEDELKMKALYFIT